MFVILNGDIAQASIRRYGIAFDEWIQANTDITVLAHENVPPMVDGKRQHP
jgi:hypothetical protein